MFFLSFGGVVGRFRSFFFVQLSQFRGISQISHAVAKTDNTHKNHKKKQASLPIDGRIPMNETEINVANRIHVTGICTYV